MMKAKLSKIDKVFFVFLVLSITLSVIWFRGGKIMAMAEEGMPFYDSIRTAQLYSSVWWEKVFPGALVSVAPMWSVQYFLASMFSHYLPNYVSQALIFALLFFSGLTGMYVFTNSVFKNRFISLVSSLFYLLNLYTMTQVWFRSVYDGMFAWAYLPLFLFLLIRWLKEGKSILLLLISSLIYVDTFSHPGYILNFILASLLVAVPIFISSKRKLAFIIRLAVAGILFSVINLWWIYLELSLIDPTFKVSLFPIQSNLDVLKGVSVSFPIQEILLLRERYYLGTWWNGWYDKIYAIIPSILILFFAIYGWLKSRKIWGWGFLTLFFFVGLFLCKGVNPPLGDIFYKVLFKLPVAGAIRNPYEKFGLTFLISYAMFFGAGFYFIYERFKGKIYRILLPFFLITIFGFFLWPYWTGKVYPDFAYVKVPDYYAETNNFINSQNPRGSILMLPLIPEHSAIFSWGYRGVEPSRFIFDQPAIAVKTYPDKKFNDLVAALGKSEDVSQYLNAFNVEYILLRDDLKWQESGTASQEISKKAIMATPNILFVKKTGEIEIYHYNVKNSLFEVDGVKAPEISFKKISPTHFVVSVTGAKKPYNLIFKENFIPIWLAKIGNETLDKHFEALSFANAWKVDKVGNYKIDVFLKIWPWQ